MVETANHPNARKPAPSVGSYVARSFVARVRSWAPLLTKATVGLLAWTGVWYAIVEVTATSQVAAIAAVGFWFGWLFILALAVFFVGVLVTGVVRDVRNPVVA
jgi:hypothetical protein